MIYEVWIIDPSGLCLIHRNYGGFQLEPNLISGFFTALYIFAREVGHSEIRNIDMGHFSFTFKVRRNLLFVVSTDDKSGYEGEKFLDLVISEFFRRFEGKLYLFSGVLRKVPEVIAFEQYIDMLAEQFNSRSKIVPISISKHDAERLYPKRKCSLIEVLRRDSDIHRDLITRFGHDSIDVLSIADGSLTITSIAKYLGLPLSKVKEIIEYAVFRGYMTLTKRPSLAEEILRKLSLGEFTIEDVKKMIASETNRTPGEDKLALVYENLRILTEKLRQMYIEQEQTHKEATKFTSIVENRKYFAIIIIMVSVTILILLMLLLSFGIK
ncbi:MAG: hypothetical protein ACTSXJ_00315 [Candidatus Baldrarchaeia archaeon]